MAKSLLFLFFIWSSVSFADSGCPMGNMQIRLTLENLYNSADEALDLKDIPGRADLRSFWMSNPESSYQDANCGTDGFYKVAIKSLEPAGMFLAFNDKDVFIPLKADGLRYPTNPYGHGIFCKLIKENLENIVVCSFYAGQGRRAYSCFSDSAVTKTRCIYEDRYP